MSASFIPVATAGANHRFGLQFSDVLAGDTATTRAGVLLQVDLGRVRAELSGIHVFFAEIPPCFSVVDFQREADGRFRFVRSGDFLLHGTRFDTEIEDLRVFFAAIEQESEDTLRDLSDDIVERTGLQLGESVDLVPIPAETDARPALEWRIGEPCWWQSRRESDFAVDGPEWVYAGSITSNYYFGKIMAFYHPNTGLLRQIFECT